MCEEGKRILYFPAAGKTPVIIFSDKKLFSVDQVSKPQFLHRVS